MSSYKENAKWLAYFAPFRALSVSAAYLTPFFLQKGLSLSQVFLLQSLFSVAFLLWELPSGYIADRFGRAFSIKLSAPIAAVAMVAYGFSSSFWQFTVWELTLALANGLISGVDTALLLDSLKADGREEEFTHASQRMQAFGFGAAALGVPVAFLLVRYVSLSSTLVADGLLTAVGTLFAFRLREAPRYNGSQESVRLSAWHATKQLVHNVEARWLVVLTSSLGAATYVSFWLSAPYYKSLGVPVELYGLILALRSLWKAVLSYKIKQTPRKLGRNLLTYTLLAGLVYAAMATGNVWLLWAVLGHDAVQALQSQPVTARLNQHMHHEYRATLNSLVNLVQRLAYALAGPLAGLAVDRLGLSAGLLVAGLACSIVSLVALARLHVLGFLHPTR